MLPELAGQEALPSELRELVRQSVALLGQVIEKEVGTKLYGRIETLRRQMAELRAGRDETAILGSLRQALEGLERLEAADRLKVAHAFTAMLELMNVCENTYRSHRLTTHARARHLAPRVAGSPAPELRPDAIIYVLTAHPTEARSPKSIHIFHQIQRILKRVLTGDRTWEETVPKLLHELELIWRVSLERERAPQVSDEAEHIYSLLLDRPILQSLLAVSAEGAPVYVRTWVGGDKDGHPKVDEKVTLESLSLSRLHLVRFAEASLAGVRETLQLLPGRLLQPELAQVARELHSVRALKPGDGGRVRKLRKAVANLSAKYEKQIGALHPTLLELKRLFAHFPGFVVPLELRESSEVLLSSPKPGTKLAIDRMLRELARLARGGDPRWYARGFIVSMTGAFEHLQIADAKARGAFGRSALPIIPLFEQARALEDSPAIVRALLKDQRLGKAVHEDWGGLFEMMVGYSDSSKESGVFPSRLAIARGMNRLDQVCRAEGVTPLFFQGSGGSVDRGGGSIEDQVGWWPRSALKNYKVTIQGEMVERSFSSPEITRGQIERISRSVGAALRKPAEPPHLPVLDDFAERIAREYGQMISDPRFLQLVAQATPYSDLAELRIGSRPARRSVEVSVTGLRAIPWVLCWTQTRVLFQTWWGVGAAWRSMNGKAREALKRAFREEPVFASYIRALGFTLGKVELAVWRIYLDRSGLDPALLEEYYSRFQAEFADALDLLRQVTGEKDPLWFRAWLGASIRLRSPMIHPLNLLQILAIEKRDFRLLRQTVTGIASGMMTTG